MFMAASMRDRPAAGVLIGRGGGERARAVRGADCARGLLAAQPFREPPRPARAAAAPGRLRDARRREPRRRRPAGRVPQGVPQAAGPLRGRSGGVGAAAGALAVSVDLSSLTAPPPRPGFRDELWERAEAAERRAARRWRATAFVAIAGALVATSAAGVLAVRGGPAFTGTYDRTMSCPVPIQGGVPVVR